MAEKVPLEFASTALWHEGPVKPPLGSQLLFKGLLLQRSLGQGQVGTKPHLRRSRGSEGRIIGRSGAGPGGPIRDALAPRDQQ